MTTDLMKLRKLVDAAHQHYVETELNMRRTPEGMHAWDDFCDKVTPAVVIELLDALEALGREVAELKTDAISYKVAWETVCDGAKDVVADLKDTREQRDTLHAGKGLVAYGALSVIKRLLKVHEDRSENDAAALAKVMLESAIDTTSQNIDSVEQNPVKKHIGWSIVDTAGFHFKFIATEYPFYGAVLQRHRFEIDAMLVPLTQDWAGLAPFTVEEVFTYD